MIVPLSNSGEDAREAVARSEAALIQPVELLASEDHADALNGYCGPVVFRHDL